MAGMAQANPGSAAQPVGSGRLRATGCPPKEVGSLPSAELTDFLMGSFTTRGEHHPALSRTAKRTPSISNAVYRRQLQTDRCLDKAKRRDNPGTSVSVGDLRSVQEPRSKCYEESTHHKCVHVFLSGRNCAPVVRSDLSGLTLNPDGWPITAVQRHSSAGPLPPLREAGLN